MRPPYALLCLLALLTFAACDTDNPDPDGPDANNDTAETTPGDPVVIDVLENDDGDDLRITAFDATSDEGGTVEEGDEDDELIYTPPAGFTGTDSFTYTVTDDRGETDTATVFVDVDDDNTGGVNEPPVANGNAAQTVAGQAVTIDVLANDFDPDGDALSIASFQDTSANDGTVTETQDGQLRYTPPADFSGTDTFTYIAEDENGAESSPATVTVEVQPAGNVAPTANDDAAQVSAGQAVTINVLDNDTDPDGDDLDLANIDMPTGGSFAAVNIETGAVRYLAPADPGVYTFEYTATDGEDTDSATVTVTVK